MFEGTAPLSSNEICFQVLGTRSENVRGLEDGEMLSSSTQCNHANNLENVNRRAEQVELRS